MEVRKMRQLAGRVRRLAGAAEHSAFAQEAGSELDLIDMCAADGLRSP